MVMQSRDHCELLTMRAGDHRSISSYPRAAGLLQGVFSGQKNDDCCRGQVAPAFLLEFDFSGPRHKGGKGLR